MPSMVGITGEDFFERAARELRQWFAADGACIGELVGNKKASQITGDDIMGTSAAMLSR